MSQCPEKPCNSQKQGLFLPTAVNFKFSIPRTLFRSSLFVFFCVWGLWWGFYRIFTPFGFIPSTQPISLVDFVLCREGASLVYVTMFI